MEYSLNSSFVFVVANRQGVHLGLAADYGRWGGQWRLVKAGSQRNRIHPSLAPGHREGHTFVSALLSRE